MKTSEAQAGAIMTPSKRNSYWLRSMIVTALIAVSTQGCSPSSSTSQDEKGSSAQVEGTEETKVEEASSQESEESESSGDAGEGGCPESSRENPIGGSGRVECSNWGIEVSEAVLVPNSQILDENMFNDTSEEKSWIVVSLNVVFKGQGIGDLDDVVSSYSFLLGSKNVTYEDNPPVNDGLSEIYGPDRYDASDPYSGGSVKLSLWFWVDNTDSDFVLALSIDEPYSETPNLWIDVASDR